MDGSNGDGADVEPASGRRCHAHRVVASFEFYAIGQGDIGGVCLNSPTYPVPPEAAAFASCVEMGPGETETHIDIRVVDSAGNPVYFTVQQEGNPAFGYGCGTLTSHPGGFPLLGLSPVVVFPWAGPGMNNVLEPGGSLCTGSIDADMIHPGTTGTVTFVFHDNIAQ